MNGCDSDVTQCFPLIDVNSTDWFAAHVCTGLSQGWISGYSDKTFKPNNYINMAEMAKIVSKVFNIEIQEDADVWYIKYMNALHQINSIPESVKTPSHFLTRGEVAEIIYRLHHEVSL